MLKYVILSLLFSGFANAQSDNSISLVWYNVENLFDTIDDPTTNDDEYLPSAPKQWNSWKYWSKLNRIAKVLRNSTGWKAPDIIILGEIENNEVLYHLSTRAPLSGTTYRIIHYDSPDRRGIDVGILYNPDVIHMYQSDTIGIHFPQHPEIKTRSILHAVGFTSNQDTIHVYGVHWPSRWGGQEESEWKRLYAAETLQRDIDSTMKNCPNARIIIAGDFNDGPNDRSVSHLCEPDSASTPLINAMRSMDTRRGTHRYGGIWEYLDQWIYSPELSDGPLFVDTTYVYWNSFMMDSPEDEFTTRPRRSWRGNMFTSGYSDHLPIVLLLNRKASTRP